MLAFYPTVLAVVKYSNTNSFVTERFAKRDGRPVKSKGSFRLFRMERASTGGWSIRGLAPTGRRFLHRGAPLKYRTNLAARVALRQTLISCGPKCRCRARQAQSFFRFLFCSFS